MLAAAVVAAPARRRLGPLLQGLVPAALIAFIPLVEHLPAIVYRSVDGGTSAASRGGVETEIFSFKLADLLLPLESHRLGFLADVTSRYRSETVLPSELGVSADRRRAFYPAAADRLGWRLLPRGERQPFYLGMFATAAGRSAAPESRAHSSAGRHDLPARDHG